MQTPNKEQNMKHVSEANKKKKILKIYTIDYN